MWTKELEQELLEIFRRLIRMDTTNPPGNELACARYLREVCDREGIENTIVAREPQRANFIARLPGDPALPQKPPILLISHLDVVPAGEGWTREPFAAGEEDGVIYGRGTLDTKHLTAMELISLLALKRYGLPLSRDILLIASADEEQGSHYGMKYLAEEHPQHFPSGYVISEGGGFVLQAGDKKLRTICCGEKGICELLVTLPSSEHPMDLLTQVLHRLSAYRSGTVMTRVAESFVQAAGEPDYADRTLQNLWEYSTRHNLVINRFDIPAPHSGEPLSLSLTFKFLHGMDPEEIPALVAGLLEGTGAQVAVTGLTGSYECEVDGEFFRILAEKTEALDPGVTLLPMIALGNTDGRFIRTNVYGYTPILEDLPFREVLKKVHQADECITIPSLVFGARVILDTLRGASCS